MIKIIDFTPEFELPKTRQKVPVLNRVLIVAFAIFLREKNALRPPPKGIMRLFYRERSFYINFFPPHSPPHPPHSPPHPPHREPFPSSSRTFHLYTLLFFILRPTLN